MIVDPILAPNELGFGVGDFFARVRGLEAATDRDPRTRPEMQQIAGAEDKTKRSQRLEYPRN